VRVQGTTLDAYVEAQGIARIDVLKMDVEGAEIDIVRGGLRLALPSTKRLVMEWHRVRSPDMPAGQTWEPVRDLLAPLGFRVALRDRGRRIVYYERDL
jgi:hypothetical protein